MGDNGLEIVLHADKVGSASLRLLPANQFLEGIRFVDLRDDSMVQLDAGLVQSMHELAVTDSFGTACGIDSDYPKLTKLGFALAAMGIGVGFTTLNRILGVTEEARLVSEISSCFLEDFLTTFTGCWYVACSWHDGFSFGSVKCCELSDCPDYATSHASART